MLKLHDAAEALPSVLDPAQSDGTSMTAALEELLSIEVEATEGRRLAVRLRFACLPTPTSLEDFDYDAATDQPPVGHVKSHDTDWDRSGSAVTMARIRVTGTDRRRIYGDLVSRERRRRTQDRMLRKLADGDKRVEELAAVCRAHGSPSQMAQNGG
ncbi:IS element ATP-binding protein [Rhodococcus jostii RHA1] [Mycolicibacterium parafortuitum]|uniref:IS element ATP-binding protein [Rhodococcus jostii RHA1] n=1 Tax=Mycolicibacterium parafortuitum TaxID=39692 RepID=A0A375YHM4_MYCPF|nr:IS element ATP-binding protein [Rhodococcus jostii RHA1] [Mycolicibacterium parafortuitum]